MTSRVSKPVLPHPTLSIVESLIAARRALAADPVRLHRLRQLQQWQVQRLRCTYADLYEDERYRDALEFFVTDLYGPHDFTTRDLDLKRALGSLERVLPRQALRAVASALELELLTHELDLRVVDRLAPGEISEQSYAKAYGSANLRNERQRQLWLIVSAGRALEELTHSRLIRTALRLAHGPAKLAGLLSVHEFLTRGFAAFSRMRNPQHLLRIIEQRETAIMQHLFAADPEPFDFQRAATLGQIKMRP